MPGRTRINVPQRGCGDVVAGADIYHVRTSILGVFQPVHTAMLRPCRIAPVQNDVVSIGQIVFIGSHHDVRMVTPRVHAQSLGLERPRTEGFGLRVVDGTTDDGKHSGSRCPTPAVADDAVLPILRVHAL